MKSSASRPSHCPPPGGEGGWETRSPEITRVNRAVQVKLCCAMVFTGAGRGCRDACRRLAFVFERRG